MKRPLLLFNALSGTVYIVTSYHHEKDKPGVIVADRKFDVTTDAMVVMSQRQQWLRAYRRRQRRYSGGAVDSRPAGSSPDRPEGPVDNRRGRP